MLKDQVTQDIKEAMKSGDSFKLGVLRMLSAAFGNAEIAARGKADLQEADYEQTIKKEVKKRTESVEMYTNAGRTEQAATEQKEIEILSAYLPEEMAEEDVRAIVEAVVTEKGIENLGMLIAEVRTRTEGRADGGLIARLVKSRIGD